MMLNFNKITLHNFGSYNHAEIDLREKGFCSVTGENRHKEDNAKSNGSGKSFIWSGICFALTGQTIQGLKSDLKNIYNDEPDAYVELDFSFDKDDYVIKRVIAPKSDLKIEKNEVDVSGKGIRESEAALHDLLPDVTQDLIASTILIGQGMPNKFSSFKPSGRKELLEKLTKSDYMIADVKARIEARKEFLSAKERELSDSFIALNTKHASAIAALEQAKVKKNSAIKPDFDAIMAKAEKNLLENKEIYDKLTAELAAKETEAEKENAKLLELTTNKANQKTHLAESYREAIAEPQKHKIEEETKKSLAESKLRALKKTPDICPTCGQKMPNSEHFKAERMKIEQEIASSAQKIKELTTTLDQAKKKNDEYSRQINESFDANIAKSNSDKAKIAAEVAGIKSKLSALTQQCESLRQEKQRAELNKLSWDREQADLDATINRLDGDRKKFDEEMKTTQSAKGDIDDRLSVVKQLETLTKRDFRGYILTDIIRYLDKKAKDFSEIVFGHRGIEIALHGNDLDIEFAGKSFDNLSGGEKTRVDLIIQFAIRELLITYLNASSNILVLDEVTDFLDKTSCDAVMRLIEAEMRSVESVFIISHHADELNIPIDSELHVVKSEDGISRIA